MIKILVAGQLIDLYTFNFAYLGTRREDAWSTHHMTGENL